MTTLTVSATDHINSGNVGLRFDAGRRVSFGGVLRSEWIKLWSLRSIKITIAITLLMGLGMSALMAFNLNSEYAGAPAEALSGFLLFSSTFTGSFVALVFGVLGVFTITSEYASGMILSSLAAVPRRGLVFAAKALILALIAAATALIVVGGGLGIATAALPEAASRLTDPIVISGALGTVAFLVLIALMAFGIAALLRSTAGGIALVAGICFVFPLALNVMQFTGWEWVTTVSAYLPTALGSTLGQGTAPLPPGMEGPTFWIALAGMAAWAAVALIPAAISFQRRDAK